MDEVLIHEQAVAEYATVRGDARVLDEAIRSVLGIELPTTPNTVTCGATHDAWWLGPDEWLLSSKIGLDPGVRQDDGLERRLRPLLTGRFASVVDVSSGLVTLPVTGPRAREVLQRGCPLDLHPRVLPIGTCAQSHYFKAAIMLRPVSDDAFELVVRRSYAEYATRMLRDAAGS